MHTVNAALEQGRQVFAVPGQVGSSGAEGPNAILREGARIVTSAEDIMDDIGYSYDNTIPLCIETEPENTLQKSIVELLRTEPLSVD